ncbi:epoxyqueuosine reductase [Pectinatus haikarae]|uniref:Epoxyqueuosine reductase QueG n=1 Tax=Pectinatus haikarae TaxID=349096 RepID=A0ABT9YA18_9FIRM|nr:epoxyqueuosine reductase [Pectinatus haikarae]MDQ0204662.1 epoxyqueuosine reductase QueG [Pectinatus haikarae]
MLINDIKAKVNEFVLKNHLNIVEHLDTLSSPPTSFEPMQIYELPLIGIAGAEDSLWNTFKSVDVIGPDHMSPGEWLPGAKSVISYFLPYTERIREANRIEKMTATEWLYGRWEGELFNQALRRVIIELVEGNGGHAMAPALNERFAVKNLRANWSERHAAFVAGLGTFSLSRSMITAKGAAGRFGSVIVDFPLEPTQRSYTEFDEYCIKCMACVRRCPPQAIDKTGKDNERCRVYIAKEKEMYTPRYGCAKCQTKVPCENRIPNNRLR